MPGVVAALWGVHERRHKACGYKQNDSAFSNAPALVPWRFSLIGFFGP
jgi:hypothetical protein